MFHRTFHELNQRYKVKYPERLDWINQYAINELVSGDTDMKHPTNNNLRFKGNLFLLIDKASFSAAATFAGVFKIVPSYFDLINGYDKVLNYTYWLIDENITTP